jgi:2-hydroxy-3-keto-5-methylthiopentenyl-1-phosphate phosphatase
MCAAMEADILFVRRGRDLETYCKREGIKHIPFDTFEAVILEIKRLLQAHQPQQ